MLQFLLSTVLTTLLITLVSLWGILSPQASAYQNGYAVSSYKNNLTYGIGVYFAPYNTIIYEKPDALSPPVFQAQWSQGEIPSSLYSPATETFHAISHVFMAFYPKLSVAAMSVVGENGDGWAEVVYDQPKRKTGWVKLADSDDAKMTGEPTHLGRFQPWIDFMKFNGRAAGIYWLTGVTSYHKNLRMQPDDKSKFLPVQIMKNIKVKHVRGNWMLVEVTDMNRQHPMGWVRWRDKDGRLMIFPNIAGHSTPYVMGMF